MEVQSDGVGANREHRDRVKHQGRPRVKTQPKPKARNEMAEGEGFEPPVPLRVRLISSQVPSTTQPPFRDSVSFENLAASRTWRTQLQRLNRAAPTNALIQPASLPRPQAQSASAPPADRKTPTHPSSSSDPLASSASARRQAVLPPRWPRFAPPRRHWKTKRLSG
jgi:hypothetical protein